MSFRYAKIEFDQLEGPRVLCGMVLWSPDLRHFKVKWIGRQDWPKELGDEGYSLATLTAKAIDHWTSTKDLPYEDSAIEPYEDKFWDTVRGALFHSVHLGDTVCTDHADPDQIESFFDEAIKAQAGG